MKKKLFIVPALAGLLLIACRPNAERLQTAPGLGASVETCINLCMDNNSPSRWAATSDGLLFAPIFSEADIVDQIEYRKADGSAFSGYEVNELLELNANGFPWSPNLRAGRWVRHDAAAYADLEGGTNLTLSVTPPYWW